MVNKDIQALCGFVLKSVSSEQSDSGARHTAPKLQFQGEALQRVLTEEIIIIYTGFTVICLA